MAPSSINASQNHIQTGKIKYAEYNVSNMIPPKKFNPKQNPNILCKKLPNGFRFPEIKIVTIHKADNLYQMRRTVPEFLISFSIY